MTKKKREINRAFLVTCIVIGFFVACLLSYFFVGFPHTNTHTVYGVSWSARHAESYGLNASTTLAMVLDDLGVRRFRLPAYWDQVEPKRGIYQFENFKNQLDMISARGGKAIIVVGATEPRWPECWLPAWVTSLPTQEREREQLAFVETTVRMFARHPAVASWQVENEPTLKGFGDCKDQRKDFIAEEMQRVRETESRVTFGVRHPVITTNSGEASLWNDFWGLTDARGISIYRLVLTPWHWYVSYDWVPPFFYARKARLVERLTGPFFVSEFQMEPWADTSLTLVPLTHQTDLMSLPRFEDHLWIAERTEFPAVYFWGVEWWAWMKKMQRHPEYWKRMKIFFTHH